MNKICTDTKQSKKLMEIGIDVNSADMYYHNRTDIKYKGALPIEYKHGNPLLSQEIPAWSLSALVDVLPIFIEFNGDKYYLRFMKEYVEYANDELSIITGRCLHTTGNDNLVDACVEMIVKLKEEKLL